MKSFIRYLISASVVAAIALAAFGVSVGIAGPLQNRKLTRQSVEAFSEWATRERARKTWEVIQRGFGKIQDAGMVVWRHEKELEIARLRQAESQQGVASLFSQAEQSVTEKLSASPIVLSQEQFQNIIKEAVAKAAEAESNKPDPRFSFNPLSGTLTFNKPLVIRGVKVVKEINLYGVLGELDVGEYVWECVEKKKVKECVSNVFAKILEHLGIKSQEEVAAGPGGW
jgi:hypothetical protein